MSFRDGITKLRGHVDKILDKIDPPKSTSGPPIPYSSRPGQPSGYPGQSQQGPPPVPQSSKPVSSDPPPYTAQDAAYWNPTFAPHIPVSEYFDYNTGGGGWGNNELQTYTSDPTNSFHTNDNTLILRCTVDSRRTGAERYTSARLVSKQRLGRRRGYLTATITPPRGKGVWPAFWLLPEEPFKWPQDGEVDIFEAWNGSDVNHSCLHWGGYSDWRDKSKHRVITTRIPAIEGQHEYGFAWDQVEGKGDGGYMIWYIDGKPVMRATRPRGTRRLECWRILLNIAVGGNVCNGNTPNDGSYDMVVSKLIMSDEPPGGWERFGQDWNSAPEGRGLD
jgi:beta-glucanase (GH16 family)